MKIGRSLLLPGLLVAVMAASMFLIVTSLQAAVRPANDSASPPAPDTVRTEGLEAQGRALFVAKGCIVCHRHASFASLQSGMLEFDDVPDLTKLKIDRTYLTNWLRNPKAMKPATAMPNLVLSETEIEALAEFLTNGKN